MRWLVGQREEAHQRGGGVVVAIVECFDGIAALADCRFQFVVCQHAVVRQAGLLDQRGDAVQHFPLLVQRGEVEHEDFRIGGEAKNRQSGGDIIADLLFIGCGSLERQRGRRRWARPQQPCTSGRGQHGEDSRDGKRNRYALAARHRFSLLDVAGGTAQVPILITWTRRLRGSGVCGGVATRRPCSPSPTGSNRAVFTPYLLAM